jgi:hypothetical protein
MQQHRESNASVKNDNALDHKKENKETVFEYMFDYNRDFQVKNNACHYEGDIKGKNNTNNKNYKGSNCNDILPNANSKQEEETNIC